MSRGLSRESHVQEFDFEPGRSLAKKYEVVRKLGGGWEGEVYLVKEKNTGIERAAKFFFPQRDPNNKLSRRYANKLHKLRDSGVLVQYHAEDSIVFRKQPVNFLVSEYVEGEVLSEYINRQSGKRLSAFEGIHLLYAIAKGMEAIHDNGEFHGDIHGSARTTDAIESDRFSRLPAYVSASRTTMGSSGRCSRTRRTKLEPMKPAPPVTSICLSIGEMGLLGVAGVAQRGLDQPVVDLALVGAGVGHPAEQRGAQGFHLLDRLLAGVGRVANVARLREIRGDVGERLRGGAVVLREPLHLAAELEVGLENAAERGAVGLQHRLPGGLHAVQGAVDRVAPAPDVPRDDRVAGDRLQIVQGRPVQAGVFAA